MLDRKNLRFFEFVAVHALRMEFDFTEKQVDVFKHALHYWLTDAEIRILEKYRQENE